MDQFVFALVPSQDPNTPISPDEPLPADRYIKGRFKVTQKGMINPNAVVYSIILGTDIGTWDFNWIGLVNSEQNLVGAISHTPIQTKSKIDKINNIAGDTLTRNIITPYTNASVLTEINVTADVWQLDFNSRLIAIDERIRLDNIDNYGQAAFIQNGWLATTRNNAITLAPGTAYIAGLQCINKQPLLVDFSGVSLPKKLYLEASFKGTVNSEWQTHTNIVIADSHPATRTENGVTYYSGEIARITTLSNITDLRTLDWRTSHLKEESNPHPQYVQTSKLDELLKAATTEAPGIIQLATQSEVNLGADAKKAITPSTLKVVTNSLEQKIDHAEEQFNRVATTTQFGLTKLATQQNVDKKIGKDEVVTVETLNKPALIALLKQWATDKANKVKEDLLGGLPATALDTFVEVGEALQETGSAVAALFKKINEKLSTVTFNEYKSYIENKLSLINQSIVTRTQIVTMLNGGNCQVGGAYRTINTVNIQMRLTDFTTKNQTSISAFRLDISNSPSHTLHFNAVSIQISYTKNGRVESATSTNGSLNISSSGYASVTYGELSRNVIAAGADPQSIKLEIAQVCVSYIANV